MGVLSLLITRVFTTRVSFVDDAFPHCWLIIKSLAPEGKSAVEGALSPVDFGAGEPPAGGIYGMED